MQHALRTLVFCALLGGAIAPCAVQAQSLLERAKQKISDRVMQRSEEGLDRALDGAENAIVCAATDKKCIQKAQRAGKTVVDEEGNPVHASTSDTAQPATGPAGARPGEGAWANYDFVPGERVIFAEDFSNDRVGNFPQRLELLGGNMEVVDWKGQRWLRVAAEGSVKIPLPEALPERFTVEFDLPLPWYEMYLYSAEDRYSTTYVHVGGLEAGLHWPNDRSSVMDPGKLFPGLEQEFQNSFLARTFRVRVHVDGKYVKVYLDDKRIANVPNAGFGRQNYLVLEFRDNTNAGSHPYSYLLTNLSINAGGREMYDALLADGRVATQGIFFDTGSDRIRPESTPTLKEITAMLQAHPDLKLTIEGHTDNTGQAAANQALSEKRAAAVKTYLVQQGIAGARLESRGLGQARPATANDTSEGRQQNRRVELVKI